MPKLPLWTQNVRFIGLSVLIAHILIAHVLGGSKGAFRAHHEHVLLELRAVQTHVLLELRAQQTVHFESNVIISAIFIKITVNKVELLYS